jgi:hypothetical protein
MAAQPRGQVRAVAAVEEPDRAVAGHVDQHGAVVTAFAEGKVAGTEHRHRPGRRLGQRLDQPQQRVPAHGHSCGSGQADSGAAGQRQRDLRQQAARQRREPAVRAGQAHHLLGERHRRAGGVAAPETPHP